MYCVKFIVWLQFCSIQKRNGSKIACIEEIAFNKGLIDENQLLELSRLYKNNEYGLYLKKLISKNWN